MNPHLSRALHLCQLALAFSRVERVTRHEDGLRPETDSDHTFMLGIIAIELAPAWLNKGLVTQFALVHDFPEVYANDVQTLKITPEERAAKEAREEAALHQLGVELGPESHLAVLLRTYEAQRLPEARFIKLLDKVLPKLTHGLNGAVAARQLVGSLQEFQELHWAQYEKLAKAYPEFPETLLLLRDSMDYADKVFFEAITFPAPVKHYRIHGESVRDIGCTRGEDGKADVLAEEPGATFEEATPEECPTCREMKNDAP